MSKETKSKIKIKTGARMDSLMSEIKKGFRLVDEKFNLVDEKIDDLAIATKIGFDGTATKADVFERFGEVNQRFDTVDSRLDSIGNDLTG